MDKATVLRRARRGLGEAEESEPSLTATERDILLAVVYADVFDFVLTHEELFARVVSSRLDRHSFAECLRGMDGKIVCDTGTYVCLPGREKLVSLRADRANLAEPLWSHARRYARWFHRVPFVRSVAVSGSLAVGNVSPTSDVDLFCITAANRLWLARLFLVPLSKLTRFLPGLFGVYLCPNYLLDQSSLAVEEHNLFTAHEILQAVPLWGFRAHAEFLRANEWAVVFLPNDVRGDSASESGFFDRPLVTRIFERSLEGKRGDFLNGLSYAVFTYFYRRRAERRGWCWPRLAPAYQIGRYTVPEGGYAAVVGARFRSRLREVAGESVSDEDIDALFPPTGERAFVYDWPALFSEEYGGES